MYTCNHCKAGFTIPYVQDDVLNDEQYEHCPICRSDDITDVSVTVTLETMGNIMKVSVRQGKRTRRLFTTLSIERAYDKLREWQWRFIYNTHVV